MRCLLQRNWHLAVRLENELLLADATYCGTDGEYSARLQVNPRTYKVLGAQWEVYRTAAGAINKIVDLPQLEGLEAYFYSGRVFREALASQQESFAAPLFADAVRAVIQAETFLYRERGYSSTDNYQEYWDKRFVNTCRYYSNLDRVQCLWYEHVGSDYRPGNLFNRMKSQFLYRSEAGYRLLGHFNDSFHGVASELELAEDGSTVLKARGDLLRAPDVVCQESTRFMQELEEKPLGGLDKRNIAELLGGSAGCVHLFEIVADGMETLVFYQNMAG